MLMLIDVVFTMLTFVVFRVIIDICKLLVKVKYSQTLYIKDGWANVTSPITL